MKPILFNTEMVRAILDGRKTVTRRVVKPVALGMTYEDGCPARNPPYRPGDILYVRETWAKSADGYYLYRSWEGPGNEPEKEDEAMKALGLKWRPSIHMPKEAARLFLRVKDVRVEQLQCMGIEDALDEGITPINRPGGCRCRFAFDGCMDEPCPNRSAYEITRHINPFAQLWDSTIKPADRALYGWEANPWVWVIEFERITKEEAENG